MSSEQPERICTDCGAAGFSTHYLPSRITELMAEHGICFRCGHLREQLERFGDTIIGGRIYSHTDRAPSPHNGMAGRRFDIEYTDGRRVTTYDLNAGLVIPEHLRAQYPDTAQFINGAGEYRMSNGGSCWDESRTASAKLDGGAA